MWHNSYATVTNASVLSSSFVAALASIKQSLPGYQVGLEGCVPPSPSCCLPVALGRDETVVANAFTIVSTSDLVIHHSGARYAS